jgi:hypothetical protein
MTSDTEQRNTLLDGTQLQRQQYQKQRQQQQQQGGKHHPSVPLSREVQEKQHQSMHNRISEASQLASQSCDQ